MQTNRLDDYDVESPTNTLADTDFGITVCHIIENYDLRGHRHYGSGMDERNPPHSGWLGNPYPKDEHGRETCIRLFRSDFKDKLRTDPNFALAVKSLSGRAVACYCRRSDEDEPACHLDVVDELLSNGFVHGCCHHLHDDTPLPDDEIEHAASKTEVRR